MMVQKENNVTLKESKCVYKVQELEFLGHKLLIIASTQSDGAVLLQFDTQETPRVITFTFKSLFDVERRYSQTEKENLALCG